MNASVQQRQAAIQPYLFFRGRAEEAISYYCDKLEAAVDMQLRFSDNPDNPSPADVPSELGDRIMHASLRIAGAELMLSDGMSAGPVDFECMGVSLNVPDAATADRFFGALAADGQVRMPMDKTFFSPRFGVVTDKFGVSWMIGVMAEA